MYLVKENKYALVKNKKADNLLIVKIMKDKAKEQYEELEVNNNRDFIVDEVEINVRLVISEEKKITIVMKKGSNDSIKQVAEELANILGISKYELTFFS